MSEAKRILFAGYAPVHFLCFLPLYERLRQDRRVEVFLSGGFRRKSAGEVSYELEGFYDPFDVDRSKVVSVENARDMEFDVVVCAHLSDQLFPPTVRRSVQIFHGVSFKNLAVREKALRFDFLCLPGRHHAELYRKQGLVVEGGSTCLVTGFPKADALVAGDDTRDALLARYGFDPSLPTVLLAPTGEKKNALETMGKEIARAFAADRSLNLLIKPHDHPKKPTDWSVELAPLENERVRVARELDVVPLLKSADLLITDASSVAVEYTLLDRPIVFVDAPAMFRRIRRRSPAFDPTASERRIGTVVEDPRRLIAAVRDSLDHPEREASMRREMAADVFHAPGSAAVRVTGVVLHAAGLCPELPAGVEVLRPTKERSADLVTDH